MTRERAEGVEEAAEPLDEAGAGDAGAQADAQAYCQVLVVFVLFSEGLDHGGYVVMEMFRIR